MFCLRKKKLILMNSQRVGLSLSAGFFNIFSTCMVSSGVIKKAFKSRHPLSSPWSYQFRKTSQLSDMLKTKTKKQQHMVLEDIWSIANSFFLREMCLNMRHVSPQNQKAWKRFFPSAAAARPTLLCLVADRVCYEQHIDSQ